MKKIILISAFLIILITPTFSQIGRKFKIDTTIRNFNLNSYKLEKSNDYNGLFGSQQDHILFAPNFLKKNFITRQNSNLEKTKSHGEMPCVIPDGYFPMKIVTPDSSKKYTLLIKQL